MEEGFDRRKARDSCELAPSRLPALLATHLQGAQAVGRRPVTREIRELIFKMVAENPTWHAPRIHGELFMLGFEVSEACLAG